MTKPLVLVTRATGKTGRPVVEQMLVHGLPTHFDNRKTRVGLTDKDSPAVTENRRHDNAEPEHAHVR